MSEDLKLFRKIFLENLKLLESNPEYLHDVLNNLVSDHSDEDVRNLFSLYKNHEIPDIYKHSNSTIIYRVLSVNQQTLSKIFNKESVELKQRSPFSSWAQSEIGVKYFLEANGFRYDSGVNVVCYKKSIKNNNDIIINIADYYKHPPIESDEFWLKDMATKEDEILIANDSYYLTINPEDVIHCDEPRN